MSEIIQYKTWADVPSNLKSKSALKKLGFKETVLKAQVYQRLSREYIDLYDINEATERPKATEKQLEAIEKARQKKIELRTCKRCGREQNKNIGNGICNSCYEMEQMDKVRNSTIELFGDFLQNKKKYVLLDTETTGLGDDDEIVDIALVNLDGEVIFESLVKPKKDIPQNVIAIHGITNEMVKDAPTWDMVWTEIKDIIKDKTLLIFNSDFDIRLIRQSCSISNIDISDIKFKDRCLMEMYMNYVYSERWISLKRALETEGIGMTQEHRAKSDCIMCLELIKAIGGKH